MATLAGCGNTKFPVRPASGTVVCAGQPVARGSITFTPIGEVGALETGKSASAALAQDGSFKLSTFGQFDGAIVGKHRVEFTGSEGQDEDETEEGDDAPAARPKAKPNQDCVLDKELILEVKSSGENVFKIELTKKKT
jgi:hypothetical protein